MGHQQWAFEQVEPGWYVLLPRSCVGSKTFGTTMVLADRTDAQTQQWAVEPLSGGGYQLRARTVSKVLDVRRASARDGADVILYAPHGRDNQRIDILPLPAVEAFTPERGAWYTLRFAHSGHVLDVDGYRCSDGAPIQQWTDWNAHNQQWCFDEVEPGWYTIRPRHCTKVLAVPSNPSVPVNVRQRSPRV
jgi:hypothetical protein